MMRRLLLVPMLLALHAAVASAQASIVPVTHAVYDWLLQERIEGRVPTYQHEVRPMSRATISGHLRTLAAMQDRLSGGERKLLDDFRNEFEMDRLIANRGWTREFFRGLPESIPAAVRGRRDPVLYAAVSRDSVISGAFYYSVGGGFLKLKEPGRTVSSYATTHAGRVFLNTSFGLGWQMDWDDIWTPNSRELVAQIPRYNTTDLRLGSTASFEQDAFLSWRAPKWIEVYLGRGGQALGTALTDPLILRPDGPVLGSLRVQIGGPRLNLVYLHGALSADSYTDTSGTALLPVYNRIAPDRFFVSQRLTWMPFPRLSLSVHEETIYANRGPDLNYLNPAVPMVVAQPRMGDRDNLLMGGDWVFRPWTGTELRGSLLIDDVDDTWGPAKKAVLVAVEQRVVPGVRVALGYIGIDPWAYTHWLRLNTYESEGKPLGPMTGPNAQEYSARMTTWLPFRTRVMAGYRYTKRGLDPQGAATDLSKCVGGNLFCGVVKKEQPLFQGADVNVIQRLELELSSELIRGLPTVLSVRDDRVLRGTRLQSQRFVDFRFRFGL